MGRACSGAAPSSVRRRVPARSRRGRGQPVRERLGVAAWEEVQRRARLAVDDQRPVVLAAPDREVIDPEDPRGRRLRVPGGHDQPQHGLPARGDAKAGGQPRSRAACQRDCDAPEHVGQQRRLARVARRQAIDLLGERPTRVAAGQTEEPAYGQHDLHWAPADRGVGEPPGVAAVDPGRHRSALRAGCLGGTRPGHHEQQASRHGDLLDDHPARCGSRTPSSTAPGHDKYTSPRDNDTTDSWKNGRQRQPLDYQESLHLTGQTRR
jgi:hypothetical protein